MGGIALAAIPAAGPAAPVVAIGEGILSLVRAFHLGGGCGAPCVDASQVEQVYEVAADFLLAVAEAGFITQSEASQAMPQLIRAGQENEANLGSQQAQAGAENLTRVITAELNAVTERVPASQSLRAWDRSQAIQVFEQAVPPSRGWYQTAYAKGQALAVRIIEEGIIVRRSPIEKLSSSLSGITGGKGGNGLLVLAALAIAAKKLL